MSAARRTGPRRALAPLPAVAALACAALTGCGSATAARDASITRRPAVQAPAGMTVCRHGGHARYVDRLTIDRVNLYPQNHVHFTFPAQLTVTSARRSRAVARALCALPAVPADFRLYSCPSDLGISYVLTFTAGNSKLALVTVDAAGCQEVDGLGPVPGLSPPRWTTRTPAFWSVLATAAGITPADQAPFRGIQGR
jgi:hypothetical protein